MGKIITKKIVVFKTTMIRLFDDNYLMMASLLSRK